MDQVAAEGERRLQEEGHVIDPEDLAHVSPYMTEHIRRFGDSHDSSFALRAAACQASSLLVHQCRLPLSTCTVNHLAGLLRRCLKAIRSKWRVLPPAPPASCALCSS